MSRRQNGKIGRRRAKREPKASFTLFCEGKNTEPAYFTAVRNIMDGTLIKIFKDVGPPMTIALEAHKYGKKMGLLKNSRRHKNSFEENDRVWAIFDRDDHEKFDDAVTLCESNGVGVARSNPCFELWLILHEADFDRPDGRDKVKRELARLRPEYNPNRRKIPDCEEMLNRLEDAERRGGKQLQRREGEGMPFGAPSTTVGDLTREIGQAAGKAKGNS